ncbi:imidazole glycerol phosphate synthase subunit HisF [Methylacidimicrobium sp. B4]|uniref:imidazole glycerol phosphate synthase subunit HisF n=1 Tax=Methylacidimicrobium sp. B4 TaxID=2796139 RepID=UPI001A8D9810|nr:imidazole glycerol phosphate synthase subunit HisF [Methylacidimicrobium sp. B4]QSR85661.1 imidazole glycerol phosphate synthase subunit HisF [Methylacidimicrobium sp. B4]
MLARRIIPCLDVHSGRVTRGQQFGRAEEGGLRDVGDPIALAARYNDQGADELVFYDITASVEGRTALLDVLCAVSDRCFIPLTAGGGVRTLEDIREMLLAGADKVSVNTAALADPSLIRAGAERFGAQCIVLSIDVRRTGPGSWQVCSHGGRRETPWEVLAWARKGVELGAGEVVCNSIDSDGMKNGYDRALVRLLADALPVPVVASGGAGKIEDFGEVFLSGHADAALAAGIFHSGEVSIPEVKRFLRAQGVPVRI